MRNKMRKTIVLVFTSLVTQFAFAQQPTSTQPQNNFPQQPTSPTINRPVMPQQAPTQQPQRPTYQPPPPPTTPQPQVSNPQQPQQAQQGSPQSPGATPTGSSEVTTVVASGDKNLYATLQTSLGKIKVELYATITPRTVRNFVELANGQKDFTDVKTGRPERRPFYDGLLFHKVIPGFAIFTGCPFGTGKGGPGFSFPDEISASLRFTKAGMVAMANTGPNSNGSQFFITLAPQPDLDDKYTIFGQVIEGMDVVRKIEKVKVGPTDRPLKRVYLKKITISE